METRKKIKVKDLVDILYDYNPNAEISVVKDGMSFDFDIAYGSSEGVTPATADTVSFYIDGETDFEQCK